jgi:hypothetical protein
MGEGIISPAINRDNNERTITKKQGHKEKNKAISKIIAHQYN